MLMEHSLIANSGIQVLTFPLTIDLQGNFKMWYHEWYDALNESWYLEPVYELRTDNDTFFYEKQKLYHGGYLADDTLEILPDDLKDDDIHPLRIEDQNCPGVKGDIFSMTFQDKHNTLSSFENVWLPIPYFLKRTIRTYYFGPLNWSRFRMIPMDEKNGKRQYQVLLVFDTRTQSTENEYNEAPVFADQFRQELEFSLCSNEYQQMDYCTAGKKWSYIEEYLFHLVYPNLQNVSQIKGGHVRRTGYLASYMFLLNYLVTHQSFPTIKLYRDTDVEVHDVDMVIDIGNSRTTALLIENNTNFNQVRPLELINYTDLLVEGKNGYCLNKHSNPFDMQMAFRRIDWGGFGAKDSQQFVYPSFVRLGEEAITLIHKATNKQNGVEMLTTYSNPKRYLWDWHPSREEWRFLVLDGEEGDSILNLPGVTNLLRSDGKVDRTGNGGTTYYYSRRSLMTFCFLEMLVQARTQINSEDYRSSKTGFGNHMVPRKIKRVIVTCPTAMSKEEREALSQCAKDAVFLFENAEVDNAKKDGSLTLSIEVVPSYRPMDDESSWYYDEATCSQLVYMYGEVGHKYKGCCSEFFQLYGKQSEGETQPSIMIGTLDIGAGTSDLMISKYSYETQDVTTITPAPQFYDSFYFAGDDMLYALVKNLMLLDEQSAFRQHLKGLSSRDYRQAMKNFFGKDHSMQTADDRTLRKNFNVQYSIPLMSYFLQLLSEGKKEATVKYADVFANSPVNPTVITEFMERTTIDITQLVWHFDYEKVATIVRKEFEPLLKKVATIMYAYDCDIVLLSGRPASLAPIRELFLKYYSVSPNRLIVLNDYYVGDWYPFSENTGYIKNPKTIVAMGGVIAHYAAELSNLNKFIIDLSLLKRDLKSTVNYIESSREGKTIGYLLTPEKQRGELVVSSLPETLRVRQLPIDSYPSRPLYRIDFNRYKLAEKMRKRAFLAGETNVTETKIMGDVKDQIDALKKRMPFKLTLERDDETPEKLNIVEITDREGNEVTESFLEVHIQSLGVEEQYWIESGAFDF